MGKREMLCDCEILHDSIVNVVKEKMLSENIIDKMIVFYKAFADSTRIKIINALKEKELCVGDISVLLNMTKSAVSHQLKNLKEINLVKSRKQGREVWYSLADNHVKVMFNVCLEHIMEK